VFSLDGPLEVAAMLATSIAKIDGEISSEEKQALLTFWFINSPKETYWENKKVKVFYAGFYPKIAVLKRGPDIFLLLILVTISMIYFFIKSIIMVKYKDI